MRAYVLIPSSYKDTSRPSDPIYLNHVCKGPSPNVAAEVLG